MSHRSATSAGNALCFAAALIVAGSWQAAAQEFFAAPRDFVIDKACNATRAIRSQADPVPLDVGKTYPARGVNKQSNPSHAFIRVDNASKWVDLTCGHFADGGNAVPGEAGNKPPVVSGQCLPFFDDVDNPVSVGAGGMADITPKAPAPTAFDSALTAACGPAGKTVSQDEFKTLMRAHPAELEAIKSFTGGQVYADRPVPASTEDYLTDLTDAWFKIGAFDHILCGEPNVGRRRGAGIGGLHFAARYLQLQASGEACRMNNLRQNEVEPGVIYTMGVEMKNANGRVVKDARKGYGLTLSGEDILKVATRAFKENPTDSGSSTGCWLPVVDDGHRFTTVFVRRATGIRTFYPDATPNGPRDRPNPDCKAAISTGN